jgi:hypothetical protein
VLQAVIDYECYENEIWRDDTWVPNTQDCCHFSDASGLIERSRNGCTRPSRRWAWDGPWNIRQDPSNSDSGGWIYATEFGAPTHEGMRLPQDMVRRRIWMRRCRIVDLSPWTQVELPLSSTGDTRLGTVSSVAVGPKGVWMITGQFQLYFRVGVSDHKLEGKDWAPVPTPPFPERFVQLNCYSDLGFCLFCYIGTLLNLLARPILPLVFGLLQR